jgi:hypothetical protein
MTGRWNPADAQSGMTRDISPGCLETWLRDVLNQHTVTPTSRNVLPKPPLDHQKGTLREQSGN